MSNYRFCRNLVEAIGRLSSGEVREVRASWQIPGQGIYGAGEKATISFSRDSRELYGHLFVNDASGKLIYSGHPANQTFGLPLDLTWEGIQ